jgi:hypothetical protein
MKKHGNNFKDLIGQVFGRLKVLKEAGRNRWQKVLWSCRCKCGAKCKVLGAYLLSGKIKSCKCLRREAIGKRNTTHGHAVHGKESSEYKSWSAMFRRSENRSGVHPSYGKSPGVPSLEIIRELLS